jgi:hypothetical protein
LRRLKKNDKQAPKRKIIRRLSNHGWVVEVPVSDDARAPKAIIEMNVFGELMSKGLYPVLTVNKDGYVMVWSTTHRRHRRLARLIMNASSVQEVSTVDGNELNLVTSNLRIENPPPPPPITYARDDFLPNDPSLNFSDVVDWEWDYDVAPPFNLDPLGEAYLNNPRIRQWHDMQAAQMN